MARCWSVRPVWSGGGAVRDHFLFWLPLVVALFLSVVGSSSGESLTLISAAVVAALLVSMLHRNQQLLARASSQRAPSVTTPAEDERCRRGAFRRQSQPDAPGRPLPRAPQPA